MGADSGLADVGPDRWRRAVRRFTRTVLERLAPGHPFRTEAILAAYFVGLALLTFAPVLTDGFVLSLDMVFSPHTDYVAFTFREKGPLYYGRLPAMALLDLAALVVPHWVLQRLVLLGIVGGSGYAMARAAARFGLLPRLFAGTLYAVNPFVYVRLLAGHWYFLLGYAALPLAVVAYHRYLDGREGDGLLPAVLWTTTVAVFDPHAAVLLVVAGVGVLAAHLSTGTGTRLRATRRTAVFGAVASGANAFWLAPAGAAFLDGTATVARFSTADLATFSARGTVLGNLPLSVSMLYGFWRGGYRYPFDLVGLPLVVGLFAVLLFLAVSGWLDRRADPLVAGLALAAVAGLLLGVGVNWPPSEPLANVVFEGTPVGLGMRDSQKFVGLVALGYAVLGAAGVARLDADYGLEERVRRARARLEGRRASAPTFDRRDALAIMAAVLLVVLPLAYTFPMVAGCWGQLETTEYPSDWYAANDRLQADAGPYRVVAMPWHLYLAFDWAGGTVANPAPFFFDRPVVTSEAVEVGGINSREGDPTRRELRTLLERRGSITHFGRELAPLGVKYVLLFRVADDERYGFLDRQADLTPVLSSDRLVLYRNEAFEAAPPPNRWPRATPPTPWWELAGGGLVSLATVVGLRWGRRWPGRA